ncbi:unnamed protein product [Darwinula stevensoni]|uniref:Uncharacterized protein n=1 Tax=Darwinula stevensoni TaxID=69355 RepID=A0A7R9A747_9CRUS|nr:unnamed protein product [Darwinula stevensoni]CAG0890250.1 unnamed protein product [Darwinula stevensoni]
MWLMLSLLGLVLLPSSLKALSVNYGPPGDPWGGSPFPTPGAPGRLIDKPGGYDGCALIVPGPGKTHHLDLAYNAFNGLGGYDGAGTCITFESVNRAFGQAKRRWGLPAAHRRELDGNEVGGIGRVLLETSRILAHQYALKPDVIINGLPLIDTSKTIIEQYCPYWLKKPKCEIKRYREYNGLCANPENPHWGATRTTFKKLIAPAYPDGLDAVRVAYDGSPLPPVRLVSTVVHRDEGYHDHAVTLFLIAWGQAIDHDITLTGETKDERNKDPECCKRQEHEDCLPIHIPDNDPFYSLFNHRCMNFLRSAPGPQYACKLGPRLSFNLLSSTIDANWVYGSKKETADALRSFEYGQLKMLPVFQEYGLKELLPLNMADPESGCLRARKDIYCFHAGDERVNEQLILTVVHTMMARYHNILAKELTRINPHWDDETTFQETRHIVAAVTQHITYNELLPMLLGKEVMAKYDLILKKDGYFDGYDPKINPTASDAFITAAYRFGHSLLPSTVERWSSNHKYIGSQRLKDMLRQPYDLYKGGWCDQYMCGLMNQVAQAMDDSVTHEVTNHLFQEPGKRFGLDLAAFNMQRGREHGIPGYGAYREFCGLPPVKTWYDLAAWMPNDTVRRYSEVYRTPADIDLWSAGISERPLTGAMVGPTFACLIALQFRDLRLGDRFWYENGGWPSSFTIGTISSPLPLPYDIGSRSTCVCCDVVSEQLNEIRKIKLSRLVCDTSDEIPEVQIYPMVLPDHEINPRVPCRSGILPVIDLSKWRDTRYSGPPVEYTKLTVVAVFSWANIAQTDVRPTSFITIHTSLLLIRVESDTRDDELCLLDLGRGGIEGLFRVDMTIRDVDPEIAAGYKPLEPEIPIGPLPGPGPIPVHDASHQEDFNVGSGFRPLKRPVPPLPPPKAGPPDGFFDDFAGTSKFPDFDTFDEPKKTLKKPSNLLPPIGKKPPPLLPPIGKKPPPPPPPPISIPPSAPSGSGPEDEKIYLYPTTNHKHPDKYHEHSVKVHSHPPDVFEYPDGKKEFVHHHYYDHFYTHYHAPPVGSASGSASAPALRTEPPPHASTLNEKKIQATSTTARNPTKDKAKTEEGPIKKMNTKQQIPNFIRSRVSNG